VGSLRLLYFESGETLGPSGPDSGAVSTAHHFLKVLLGSRCSGVLGAWWEKSKGAAVAGLHRFVDSSLSLFLFFWVCFCCRPNISLFRTIVSSMWLLYNI
jgi:hypothetical protein